MRKTLKKAGAVLCSLALVLTSVTVFNSAIKAEDVETPSEKTTIAAFEFDGTEKTVKKDLDEYSELGYEPGDDISEEDNAKTYNYLATTGTGVLVASTTGTGLKHISWSSDLDYKDVDGNELGISVPAVGASGKNPWSADAYAKVTFSTESYTDISFSMDVAATKKGPMNYSIVYYDENGEQQMLTSFSLAKNKRFQTESVPLPEELENRETVSIYLVLANTTNRNEVDITAEENSASGEFAVNNIIISGVKAEEADESTTAASEITTAASDETTTVANDETTTKAVENTTTAASETTTAAKDDNLSKATFSKIAKKKKAAKKVKVTVKKVDGATGYEARVYGSKSNAKKNKKVLAKKTSKKVKITVSGKKLANRKKLFIKVRAYKTVNGTKTYGDWSAVKRIKIKK